MTVLRQKTFFYVLLNIRSISDRETIFNLQLFSELRKLKLMTLVYSEFQTILRVSLAEEN